jgi:glycosyltransferase involved in cell wall biosynthesis
MTTNTTRIAFMGIKGLPSKAGADRVVEAIVQRLDKQQYELTAYCSGAVVPEGTRLEGVKLVRIPVLPGKYLHAPSLFLFSALHALWRGGYDMVHVHNVEACFVLPLLRLRYKVISTSHGPAYKRDKWGEFAKSVIRLTEYPYISFSNVVTSVSRHLATYYQQTYKKQVHYLPNGVDSDIRIDDAAAGEILQQHGLQRGEYILFAAGRIMATKGCHFLLQAFREVPGDMKLLVVGDLTQIPAYAQQLHELADERVHFVPFVDSKETLLGIVQNCRVFVFPSTVEAMSMMLLEVASLGVPIVCSDIPENIDVVPERALFFESANVADLREKLEWALAHPEEMQQLARRAQEWVNQNNQWDTIVKDYEVLYQAM